MYPVIEQIAHDTGIGIEQAGYAFRIIATELLNKIPQLEQIIDDVFAHAEADKLKEHVSKVIMLLQQQEMDVFKTWTMPQTTDRIPYSGNIHIL